MESKSDKSLSRKSSSKEIDCKDQGSRDPLDVIESYASTLETEFEDFANEHYDVFECICEMTVKDEHPVKFNEIYQEYLTRFSIKIEKILEKEGCNSQTFYAQARVILDEYPRGHPKKIFVQTILAASDYDMFFSFMQEEIQYLKKIKSHSSKSGKK